MRSVEWVAFRTKLRHHRFCVDNASGVAESSAPFSGHTTSRPREEQRMKRTRSMVRILTAAVGLVLVGVTIDAKRPAQRFDLVEASIASIHDAIDNHVITAKQLVEMYQARIAAYDAKNTATHLNSYIFVNRDARKAAEDTDVKHGDGPLAGIPMILKDNVDTK